MGTKNVRLDEDVYERVKSEKQDDETFSEAIDRLIGDASLLELVGILTEDQADAMRGAIEDVDADATADVDELVERFGDDDG